MAAARTGTYSLRFIESLEDPEVEVVLLKITLEHMLLDLFPPRGAGPDAETPLRELLRRAGDRLSDAGAVERGLTHRNDIVHTTPDRYPPTAKQVAFARDALRTAVTDLLPHVSRPLRKHVSSDGTATNRWQGAIESAALNLHELSRTVRAPLVVRVLRQVRVANLTRRVLPRQLMMVHALVAGPARDGLAKYRGKPLQSSSGKPSRADQQLAATGWFERGRLPVGRRSVPEIREAPTPVIQLLLITSLLEYLLVLSDPEMKDDDGRPATIGYRVNSGRWWPKPGPRGQAQSGRGQKGKIVILLNTALGIRNRIEHASREPVDPGKVQWAMTVCLDAVRDLLPKLKEPLRVVAKEAREVRGSWPDLKHKSRRHLEMILADWSRAKKAQESPLRGGPLRPLHRALDRLDGSGDLLLALEQGTIPAIELELKA